MARIVYGPLVTAVKGSIGGVTFQGNRSGNIIRSRPHLSKVSTVKQSAAHGNLEQLLYEWQQLTQAQRDAWNLYADTWTKENKFGESKTLTGQNWFTSVNYYWLKMFSVILPSPPVHTLPQAPPDFVVNMSPATISITLLSAFDFGNNLLNIWTSLPTKRNTLSINSIRKEVESAFSPIAHPIDITASWEAATGINWNPSVDFPSANIFVCLQSLSINSGITSSLLCTKNSTPALDTSTIYYYA